MYYALETIGVHGGNRGRVPAPRRDGRREGSAETRVLGPRSRDTRNNAQDGIGYFKLLSTYIPEV